MTQEQAGGKAAEEPATVVVVGPDGRPIGTVEVPSMREPGVAERESSAYR